MATSKQLEQKTQQNNAKIEKLSNELRECKEKKKNLAVELKVAKAADKEKAAAKKKK